MITYDFAGMVSSHNPEATRNTAPVFFAPGGSGWMGWGRWRAEVLRQCREAAPTLRIKCLVHMRGGVLEGERFRLDAPYRARLECPALGDETAMLDAFELIKDVTGRPLAMYEGAIDTGASATEDPFEVWDDINHRLAASGLVDEWIFDATAATRNQAADADVPDPRVTRMFDRIERRYGHAVRCEAWPLTHNAALCTGRRGVFITSHDYCRSTQQGARPVIEVGRPLNPQFLPRDQVAGPCLMGCMIAGRDHVADARAWLGSHPRNQVAFDFQGWLAGGRSVTLLASAIATAAPAGGDA